VGKGAGGATGVKPIETGAHVTKSETLPSSSVALTRKPYVCPGSPV